MDPGKSSEAFIKALKGKETSISKIELAAEGWHSKALYLPGKHSVIADWVIQSLCEGTSDSRLSPSTEAHHWQLLAEIITAQDAKSTNSWLTTILARRAILPVLASTALKLGSSPDVVAPFAVVYRQVLPLALPKATDEFILSCFWAPLDSISSDSNTSAPDPRITDIWIQGLEAFRSKFNQIKDKKRIISSFLDQRLSKWGRVIQLTVLPDELRVALRAAGDILMFGTTEGLLLVMEQPPDSPSTSTPPSSQSSHFFASLKRFVEQDDSAVLPSLFPTFLQSFTKSIQRSHLDLSQILNRDVTSEMRVRVAATYFLNSCLLGPLAFSLSTSDDKHRLMETRLGLFQVMTEEGYLDSEQSDAKGVLQREIEFTMGGLQRGDARDAALEILTIILKQDFDLINPVASKILGVLSRLPPSSFHSCNSFLSSLLGFHCKTRTIQVHIHGLVDCLVSTPGSDYVSVSCGPLFASTEYAKELHQAIRLFLTPSQIPSVVKLLVDTFKQLWGLAKLTDLAESDEMLTDTASALSDIADPATALSLLTRLIDKVSSAISMLDPTTQLYLQDLLDTFLRRDVLHQLVSRLETAPTQQESSQIQIGIRAILHLGYCMDKLSKVWESSFKLANDEPHGSLIRVLELPRVDPELLLEAAAATLHHASSSPSAIVSSSSGSCGTVVSLFLNHIQLNLEAAISSKTLWSGQAAYLPSPSHLVVALVDLLLGRWLYVLEHSAPDECLQRLGKLVIRLSEIPTTVLEPVEPMRAEATSESINNANQFNVADVVWNAFASGEFWEMRRLRVALMSTAVELTADIDELSTPLVFSDPQSLKPVDRGALAKHVACYRSMLYFPLEYFTRTSKPILSSRAITLDSMIAAAAMNPASSLTESEAVEWRLVVRTVIDRIMAPEALVKIPGVLEHFVSTTGHPSVNPYPHHVELERVTLRITSKAFSALAASSASQDSDSVRPIVQSYIGAHASSLENSEGKGASSAQLRGLFGLLDAFVEDSRYSEVDSGVRALLDDLHKQLETWLTTQLDQILNSPSGADEESLTKTYLAVDGWRTSTKYRRWKGDLSDPIPFSAARFLPLLSQRLGTSQTGHNSAVATLGIAVFRLMLEVLQDSSEDSIESAIACFILLYRFKSGNDELPNRLLDSLSQSLRQWSADQYSAGVGLISDFYRLSSSKKAPEHSSNLGALFRLSAVLIVDAPEGTGKLAHSLLQQSLLAMLRATKLGGPTDVDSLESCFVLVHEATSFIERVCNEKPSFLRDVEMGHILTILHTVLAPPSTSAIALCARPSGIPTSSTIYSAITNTLITLVRNQRELLRTHFPDFTQLLCLLLSSLKTVHEGLGARSGSPGAWRSTLNNKSIELIQSGLPWWVSATGNDPSFKLNEQDARQLNRLLMSLTTKTFGRDVPGRRPRGSERAPKADSLASSFSNYATFVLIAYVRTVTDSYHIRSGGLTTLTKSVRRELEEGISELCGMIGDNRRDWVYQSLTSDGRSLFKTVWARYEKHRYTGTG